MAEDTRTPNDPDAGVEGKRLPDTPDQDEDRESRASVRRLLGQVFTSPAFLAGLSILMACVSITLTLFLAVIGGAIGFLELRLGLQESSIVRQCKESDAEAAAEFQEEAATLRESRKAYEDAVKATRAGIVELTTVIDEYTSPKYGSDASAQERTTTDADLRRALLRVQCVMVGGQESTRGACPELIEFYRELGIPEAAPQRPAIP